MQAQQGQALAVGVKQQETHLLAQYNLQIILAVAVGMVAQEMLEVQEIQVPQQIHLR